MILALYALISRNICKMNSESKFSQFPHCEISAPLCLNFREIIAKALSRRLLVSRKKCVMENFYQFIYYVSTTIAIALHTTCVHS